MIGERSHTRFQSLCTAGQRGGGEVISFPVFPSPRLGLLTRYLMVSLLIREQSNDEQSKYVKKNIPPPNFGQPTEKKNCSNSRQGWRSFCQSHARKPTSEGGWVRDRKRPKVVDRHRHFGLEYKLGSPWCFYSFRLVSDQEHTVPPIMLSLFQVHGSLLWST